MGLIFRMLIVVATDCFKLNSQCVYSAQRSSVNFVAIPSKELIGEEKRLCENVINGQLFELQVQLGNVIFRKTGLTYNKDNEINTEVVCQGNISKCAFSHVQKVQTATYTLIFPDIDLTLTSIVNFYEIDKYDHLSCIRTTNLIYDGVKKTLDIDIVDPVIQCPCNLIDPNSSNPPPFKNKNNVFIISKMGETTVSTHGYNKLNYTGVLKFNNGTPNSSQPSQLDKFWTELTSFGQYNQQNLPTIGILLSTIRNTPVIDLSMKIQLLTEIKQVRDSNSKPTKSFYYNQSIQYAIAELTNINQADCFTGVDVELHKTFFYINTAQNPKPTKCSRQYIETMTNSKYDSITLQIIVSQNIDKSGFNYYANHVLDNFSLGMDINQRFPCKDENDCAKLQEISRLQRHYYNMSVSTKLLFTMSETTIFAISYNTKFSLTNFNQTNLSVFKERICLEVQPIEVGSEEVDFSLLGYEFDLSQYMTKEQTTYCSELKSNEQASIGKIITKMKGNIDIKPYTSLKIGNSIVGDILVTVYQIPKNNILVYIICGVMAAAAVCGSFGVGFGFKKAKNVWGDNHAIVIES